MTAYATVEQVEAGFRELSADEEDVCTQLLLEAGALIDAVKADASADAKQVVSCRMVRRALGADAGGFAMPMGTTQGSMTAGVYTQSFTVGSGSLGELYLEKTERLLLGAANRLGARSVLEDMVPEVSA